MFSIVLVASLTAQAQTPPQSEAAAAKPCLACHTRASPHVVEWERSQHARIGIGCESCHAAAPMMGASVPHGAERRVSAAGVVELCSRCHADVASAFTASPHYRAVISSGQGPTCSDCHGSAGGSVLVDTDFAHSCGNCHRGHIFASGGNVASQGQQLLTLLRQVTLARALVREELAQAGRKRSDLPPLRAALAEAEASVADLRVEWHRFDFAGAEARCRRALEALSRVHAALDEGRER